MSGKYEGFEMNLTQNELLENETWFGVNGDIDDFIFYYEYEKLYSDR